MGLYNETETHVHVPRSAARGFAWGGIGPKLVIGTRASLDSSFLRFFSIRAWRCWRGGWLDKSIAVERRVDSIPVERDISEMGVDLEGNVA